MVRPSGLCLAWLLALPSWRLGGGWRRVYEKERVGRGQPLGSFEDPNPQEHGTC